MKLAHKKKSTVMEKHMKKQNTEMSSLQFLS